MSTDQLTICEHYRVEIGVTKECVKALSQHVKVAWDPGLGESTTVIRTSTMEFRWQIAVAAIERKVALAAMADGSVTYSIGGVDCWQRGCWHQIYCPPPADGDYWEVTHYLRGESDYGEAYKRFNYVDYVPTKECQSPYDAVIKWLDEIHAYIDQAAAEVRYH